MKNQLKDLKGQFNLKEPEGELLRRDLKYTKLEETEMALRTALEEGRKLREILYFSLSQT